VLRQLWVNQLRLDTVILGHWDMVDDFEVVDPCRLSVDNGNTLREGVGGALLVESTLGDFLLTWMVGDFNGWVQPVNCRKKR